MTIIVIHTCLLLKNFIVIHTCLLLKNVLYPYGDDRIVGWIVRDVSDARILGWIIQDVWVSDQIM